MSGKKHAMVKNSNAIGSDLKKVDAYVLGPKEYEEIPELTDEDFARGVWHKGGKPLPYGPRGRPRSKNPKHAVSLRLDHDVLAHFRRTGHGWQSRINAALRKAANLPKEKPKKAR